MFGASPVTAPRASVAFVAPAAIEAGLAESVEAKRDLVPVRNTRQLTKADMPLNDALPR